MSKGLKGWGNGDNDLFGLNYEIKKAWGYERNRFR